jgi:hypothetical protein
VTSLAARRVANVVLVSVGVAAASVVLTTPSLRRLAFRATRIWLGASIPAYLLNQTHHAWAEPVPAFDVVAGEAAERGQRWLH